MKRIAKYISAFLVASSLSAGGALAGGDLKHDRYSAWSGFYAGLTAGYGEASYDGVFDSADADDQQAFASDLDLNGLVAGVHIGYNWQHNNIVIGVEADATVAGFSDSANDRDGGADLVEGDIDFLGSIRGRLGLVHGSTLFYATGGIAFADATYTARNNGGTGSNAGTVEFDSVGYVVGGGLEKSYGGLRLKLEGLYYGFDDEVDTSDLANDSDTNDFAKFEDIWTVRVGVSVPFGK